MNMSVQSHFVHFAASLHALQKHELKKEIYLQHYLSNFQNY